MVRGREWTGFEAAALQEAMRCSVRDFAHMLGVETTTIANWRSGLSTVTPRPRTQAILDTTYQQRATPEDRQRFTQIVAEGEAAWRARRAAARQDDPRVGAGTAPVAVGDSDVFERPAEILQRMRQLRSHEVHNAELDIIGLAFANILDRYELEGPVRLAPEVRSLRREVDSLLAQCHQPLQLQRLYRLAGQIAGVLGYMAVNLGRFRFASMYCQEALSVAEFIRDTDLQAWVKGTQSFCAYYRGDYRAASALAQEGIQLAPSSGQAVRLYTNGLARALGKLRDTVGVERAIDAAMTVASSVDAPPGLTPALSFETYSSARLKANAATAYLSAGEYNKVLTYGQQVEDLVNSSDSVWSRSLVRLDVATALVHQPHRDVEYAMNLGIEALDASQDRPIRSVWQRAHDLADVVATVDTRKVRDYVGELREWSANAKPMTAPDSPTPEAG
ncbi:tetratricopeptide (TPR) repeat protein [Nocardia kruczakiae]|uniref:Tetratricopeptide (TPR) repeat protein n=1 Tax=Nocardia kruczakiae TaxID=261477 RepID=A0ABU1XQM4_9NOCA|nr:hypothetical protein [Nocardia kruczakiae]MDR7172858.1 tetratricopeptide (TPR) repeat protein [Nocardia kruczakiae]